MVSRTLDKRSDHEDRVKSAESSARTVDRTRADFVAFQAALTPLEKLLQDLWSTSNHRSTSNKSSIIIFAEQKEQCKVTGHVLDSLVSRYDRYLTLV